MYMTINTRDHERSLDFSATHRFRRDDEKEFPLRRPSAERPRSAHSWRASRVACVGESGIQTDPPWTRLLAFPGSEFVLSTNSEKLNLG